MERKPIRQVKLYGKYRPSKDWHNAGSTCVPWLNVSGRWLEQAGFHINDPIEISVKGRQLIIKHRKGHGDQRH